MGFNEEIIKALTSLLNEEIIALTARCRQIHVINIASMPIHLHRPIHVMYWTPLEHTCTETLLLQNLKYPKPAGPRSAIGRASDS